MLDFVPKGLDKKKDYLDNYLDNFAMIAHWTTLRFSQAALMHFPYFSLKKKRLSVQYSFDLSVHSGRA